jgi:hypothetical protein
MDGERGLRQLVYVSAATRPFSEDELVALLALSRARNAERDVTGRLLHVDGSFIQAIEGSGAAVQELFGRIARDPRHRGIVVLEDGPIPARGFAAWRMDYRRLARAEIEQRGVAILAALAPPEGAAGPLPPRQSVAWTLLQSFTRTMYGPASAEPAPRPAAEVPAAPGAEAGGQIGQI